MQRRPCPRVTNAAMHALAAFVALAIAVAMAAPLGAATIDEPVATPAPARGGLALTVRASGFRPGAAVYVEQCDGTAPTAPQWSPASNCDMGSSPAPVLANARGVATFAEDDENHAFRPFSGESPQSLFNCVAPRTVAPKNALETYDNCQLRVSTNNLAVTTDQAFLRLVLAPGPAATGLPTTTTTVSGARSNTATTVPTAPTTRAGARGSTTTIRTSAPRAADDLKDGEGASPGGRGDGLDVNEGASAGLFLAVGAVLALACVLLRRRDAARAGPPR